MGNHELALVINNVIKSLTLLGFIYHLGGCLIQSAHERVLDFLVVICEAKLRFFTVFQV